LYGIVLRWILIHASFIDNDFTIFLFHEHWGPIILLGSIALLGVGRWHREASPLQCFAINFLGFRHIHAVTAVTFSKWFWPSQNLLLDVRGTTYKSIFNAIYVYSNAIVDLSPKALRPRLINRTNGLAVLLHSFTLSTQILIIS